MNTIDWDKIKTALNEDIKLEDKMFIIPMSLVEAFYSKLKADVMKDVIPIEWIKEWQNRHEWQYESYFTMRDGRPKYAIECLLEDWEIENEERTNA